MIRAAGILYVAPDDRVLFLKRGPGGDHAGEWCFPGGKVEGDETAEQAALREAQEELGFLPKTGGHPLRELTRSERHDAEPHDVVDFTTFVQRVPAEFTPEPEAVAAEHVGWCWAPRSDPPRPLHPGCEVALRREEMTELDVARAVAGGELTSPQCVGSMCLYDMRITGTGAAYRKGLDEYVWRAPELYLNEEFLARCNGLPVIWEHTKGSQLDSKEFSQRVVGTVLLPYLRAEEVWGVSRIYDEEAIDLMNRGDLSTSPAVVFGDPSVNKTLEADDGKKILIEGVPTLLDHLAVCEKGVWDKGGDSSGIEVKKDADMSKQDVIRHDADELPPELKEKAEENEAKQDADAGEKLDKALACLDALARRMDSYEEEEEKKRQDAAKLDAEGDGEGDGEDDGEVDEPGKPRPVVADKKSKKDELGDEGEKDIAKKDSEVDDLRRQLQMLEQRIPRQLADSDRAQLAEIQARADAVYSAFSDSAPRPMDGETPLDYRRRLARKLKKHSAAWRDVDLSVLPANVVGVAEAQIYADSLAAARNPQDLGEGELREVVSVDSTGRRISSFYGEPRSWLSPFSSGTRRRLVGIRTESH